MKKIHIILCLLSLASASLKAQNIQEDIACINEAYQELQSLEATVSYELYANHSTQQATEKSKGNFAMQGENSRMQFGGMLTLVNEEVALLVHPGQQSVIVQGAPERGKNPVADYKLEDLIAFCDSVKFQALSGDRHQYRFVFSNYEFDEIQVVFNPETCLLTDIVWLFNEAATTPGAGGRKEVHYREIKINQTIAAETFTVKGYLVKTDKRWSLDPAYDHFQLYDFTQTNQ